ncbi:MAG: diguanylate cyclase [Gammaproteobacteria bacterium]|nr:diguanylate cyclase [Gammaproteobacteria bacterium]
MNNYPPDIQPAKIRVLIVDDAPDILSALSTVLELEEIYQLKTASTAEAAQQAAADFHPDIALIDVKLGQDNGLDLIPIFKKALPDIVCIVMTAYRDAEHAVKAIHTGADDYLYKPLEPSELLKSLKRFNNQQRLKREKLEIERRFRAVFDQAFQLLFLLEVDGRIVDINQTVRDMMAGTEQTDIGQYIWEVPLWTDNSEQRELLREAVARVAAGGFDRLELGIENHHDGELTLDVSLKPIIDEQGSVAQILCEARDITERKRAETRIAHMAFHDALTGLPNRYLLRDRLHQEIAVAKRHQKFGALLFLDLDRFKEINDTLGHAAGDELLRQTAERLLNSVREVDTVARMGGDEFVVMMPNLNAEKQQTASEQVGMMVDRIHRSLAMPYELEGKSLRVTSSIGVTLFSNRMTTVDELLKQADSAMYSSKSEGRNKVNYFVV